MMLNAMSPQRHHQQTVADSQLLLARNSSSISNISSSPSSSSSVSSSSNCNNTKTDNNNSSSNNLDSLTNNQFKSNMVTTPNETASTKNTNICNNSGDNRGVTPSDQGNMVSLTNSPRHKVSNTAHLGHHNYNLNNHHQQNHHIYNHFHQLDQQHHFSHYPSRYDHHHSNHHHNTGYSTRSNNNHQRGHNSHNDHHNSNHQQHLHQTLNHHSSHNHNNNGNHNVNKQVLNEVVVSTSSPSWSPSKDVVSANTTPNSAQRHQRHTGPPYYVDLHVNAGECVSLQLLDGQEQVVAGPATITMVSQQPTPPVPIPVQVPPGHMVHQIADENGTLKHIILSVMRSNDDGASLDSTVITLPQGAFRIDSHGDLVSVNSRTDNGEAAVTLSQPGYFASYDGCPVMYEQTMLPEAIDTTMSCSPSFQMQAMLSPDQSMIQGASPYAPPMYPSYETMPTLAHLVASSNHKSKVIGGPNNQNAHHQVSKSQTYQNNNTENDGKLARHPARDLQQNGEYSFGLNGRPSAEFKRQQLVSDDKIVANPNSNIRPSSGNMKVIGSKDIIVGPSRNTTLSGASPGRHRTNRGQTHRQQNQININRPSKNETSRERSAKDGVSQLPSSTISNLSNNQTQTIHRKSIKNDQASVLTSKEPPKYTIKNGDHTKDFEDGVVSGGEAPLSHHHKEQNLDKSDESETRQLTECPTKDSGLVKDPNHNVGQQLDENIAWSQNSDSMEQKHHHSVDSQAPPSYEDQGRSTPSTTGSDKRDSDWSEPKSTRSRQKKCQNQSKPIKSLPEMTRITNVKSQQNMTKSDVDVNAKNSKVPGPSDNPSASTTNSSGSIEQDKTSNIIDINHNKDENVKIVTSSVKESYQKSGAGKNHNQKHKEKNHTQSNGNSKKSVGGVRAPIQRSSSMDTSNRTNPLSNQINHRDNNGSRASTSPSSRSSNRGDNTLSSSPKISSHHHHTNHQQHNMSYHGLHSCGQSLSNRVNHHLRQCRTKSTALLGKIVQSFLSSNPKIASVVIIVFSCFSMLLAMLIHVCIQKPLRE